MTEPPLVLAAIRAATGVFPTHARLLWRMYCGEKLSAHKVARITRGSINGASVHLCNLRASAVKDWLGVTMGDRFDDHNGNEKVTHLLPAGRDAIRAILVQMRDEALNAMANHG